MDEFLHSDFARAISEYPGVELKTYGPYMEDVFPQINLMPYRIETTMEDILKIYQPNVILFCTKSRMFKHYVPNKELPPGSCWLPTGWEDVKIPKVMLEEDYFYEKNDDWYWKNGIKTILQRHYSQSFRSEKCKHIWFPFSIDPNQFSGYPSFTRKNKVCFVGSCGSDVYKWRRLAIEQLSKEGLIDVFCKNEKVGIDYIDTLRSYTCHLAGTLIYDTTPSKIFEIMATGGVLLVNTTKQLRKLFPRGGYIDYNENSVVKVVKDFLRDYQDLQRYYSTLAIKDIMEKHTHEIRIKQLLNILENRI